MSFHKMPEHFRKTLQNMQSWQIKKQSYWWFHLDQFKLVWDGHTQLLFVVPTDHQEGTDGRKPESPNRTNSATSLPTENQEQTPPWL